MWSIECLLYWFSEMDEDEHLLACLLMVFVAVSIPKLARNENSFYRASLEGHANNIHCMAAAVNNIFGALFHICGQGDIEDRMKEFLAVSNDVQDLLYLYKTSSELIIWKLLVCRNSGILSASSSQLWKIFSVRQGNSMHRDMFYFRFITAEMFECRLPHLRRY